MARDSVPAPDRRRMLSHYDTVWTTLLRALGVTEPVAEFTLHVAVDQPPTLTCRYYASTTDNALRTLVVELETLPPPQQLPLES